MIVVLVKTSTGDHLSATGGNGRRDFVLVFVFALRTGIIISQLNFLQGPSIGRIARQSAVTARRQHL